MLIPVDITCNRFNFFSNFNERLSYMYSASLQKIKHQLENQEIMDFNP